MKLGLSLAAATALATVMVSAALADGNKAYTLQDGSTNSASVNQSGGTNNQAGRVGDAMTQSGNGNLLTIVQSGTDGQIGTKTGTVGYNTLAASPQFSLTFNGVDQVSSGGGSNTAVLTQTGSNSLIGQLQQNAGTTAAGNSATVSQAGNNRIVHIFQVQDTGSSNTNVINATQSGDFNVITRIDQRAAGTGSLANQINVNISGTGNGNDLNSIPAFYSSRAGLAGGTHSSLIQNKYGSLTGVADPNTVSGNLINLTITGSNNQFGMTQKGTENTTGVVTISGDNNSFGSYQAGESNLIGAGEIAGDFNDTGIYQSGSTNSATVSVLAAGSNNNSLLIAQRGDGNDALANITGSGNGNGVFTGVAAGLVSGSSGALDNGLIAQAGLLGTGNDNFATLTINGDNNSFAVTSLGNSNTVSGTISSNGNSAAVLQVGNTNTASFTQSGGNGNSTAISQ